MLYKKMILFYTVSKDLHILIDCSIMSHSAPRLFDDAPSFVLLTRSPSLFLFTHHVVSIVTVARAP